MKREFGNREGRLANATRAITSRTTIMQGGTMGRMFTSLMTFMNQRLQDQYEAGWRARDAKRMIFNEGEYIEGLKQIPRAAMLLTVGLVAPALVEQLVTPYITKKDSYFTGGLKV